MSDLIPPPIPQRPEVPWTRYESTVGVEYRGLTEASLAAALAAEEAWLREAVAAREARIAAADQAAQILMAAGFSSTRLERRSIGKGSAEMLAEALRRFVHVELPYARCFAAERSWLDAERRRAEDERRLDEGRALQDGAIAWLLARGEVFGQRGFTTSGAVVLADELACYDLIGQMDAEWHAFDGDENCSRECRGWDGESARCDCGNRRVAWERDEWSTFEAPSVRAVAN